MAINETDHLLVCLAEECAEVSQRVTKALRFGIDEVQPEQALTNAERIEHELFDLLAVWEILNMRGILKGPRSNHAIDWQGMKMRKVEHFMNYAASIGAMLPEEK